MKDGRFGMNVVWVEGLICNSKVGAEHNQIVFRLCSFRFNREVCTLMLCRVSYHFVYNCDSR